ncbi:hypothetical protein SK128_007759 [Halocaridina rubra]|uniref:Uncharacterized protein n=1 Tax=Halocaridina rubra TaxID=373956 RepID=A0AAN8XJL5_HALRR
MITYLYNFLAVLAIASTFITLEYFSYRERCSVIGTMLESIAGVNEALSPGSTLVRVLEFMRKLSFMQKVIPAFPRPPNPQLMKEVQFINYIFSTSDPFDTLLAKHDNYLNSVLVWNESWKMIPIIGKKFILNEPEVLFLETKEGMTWCPLLVSTIVMVVLVIISTITHSSTSPKPENSSFSCEHLNNEYVGQDKQILLVEEMEVRKDTEPSETEVSSNSESVSSDEESTTSVEEIPRIGNEYKEKALDEACEQYVSKMCRKIDRVMGGQKMVKRQKFIEGSSASSDSSEPLVLYESLYDIPLDSSSDIEDVTSRAPRKKYTHDDFKEDIVDDDEYYEDDDDSDLEDRESEDSEESDFNEGALGEDEYSEVDDDNDLKDRESEDSKESDEDDNAVTEPDNQESEEELDLDENGQIKLPCVFEAEFKNGPHYLPHGQENIEYLSDNVISLINLGELPTGENITEPGDILTCMLFTTVSRLQDYWDTCDKCNLTLPLGTANLLRPPSEQCKCPIDEGIEDSIPDGSVSDGSPSIPDQPVAEENERSSQYRNTYDKGWLSLPVGISKFSITDEEADDNAPNGSVRDESYSIPDQPLTEEHESISIAEDGICFCQAHEFYSTELEICLEAFLAVLKNPSLMRCIEIGDLYEALCRLPPQERIVGLNHFLVRLFILASGLDIYLNCVLSEAAADVPYNEYVNDEKIDLDMLTNVQTMFIKNTLFYYENIYCLIKQCEHYLKHVSYEEYEVEDVVVVEEPVHGVEVVANKRRDKPKPPKAYSGLRNTEHIWWLVATILGFYGGWWPRFWNSVLRIPKGGCLSTE